MTEILPAVERARNVLQKNRYFVLATNDERGPWAAALAFAPALPAKLFFISRTGARHSIAIENNSQVAGVIYDSTATIDDVECIQFSGRGRKVRDSHEARIALKGHPADKGEDPDDEAVRQLLNNPDEAAYCITIQDAYVLDQLTWQTQGIDAREPVQILDVFSNYFLSINSEG